MALLALIAAGLFSLSAAQAHSIDAIVQKTLTSSKTPGVSIAIVRDNRIVYARGYGYRDLAVHVPVDAQTVFRWGSVSKQFAAGSILMLEAQGKLSVDDPVSRWFPALTDSRTITVRDLLNQVSGYRDYYPLDYVDIEMSRPTTMNAILHEYAQSALTAPPEARWEYSNTNYTLLGAILQRVSGESAPDFYNEHIFEPLAMTRSGYDEPMKSEPDRATGYNSFWEEPPHADAVEADGWLNTAGALAGTASDLARWDIALMTRTIISPREFSEMAQSRHLHGGQVDTGYGFGVGVEHRNGHLLLTHGGNVIGFASSNILLPDDRTAVVVLTNSYEAPADEFAMGIAKALVPALARTAKSKANPPAKPDAAADAAVQRIKTGLTELANGTMPSSVMTADFAYLLTPQNKARAEESFKQLGAIRTVQWLDTSPRGGLSVTAAAVQFQHGSGTAVLYETPSHRIAELMIFP